MVIVAVEGQVIGQLRSMAELQPVVILVVASAFEISRVSNNRKTGYA